MEGGKQTRGRQKIELKKIENDEDRYATFSKRKNGIYKKASEICTQCSADIGIILFSPTNKPYSFFHPNVDTVLNRFRNINQEPDRVDQILLAHNRAHVGQLNRLLDDFESQMETEKERAKRLNQIGAPKDKLGWLETPIEEMNKETVTNLEAWIREMIDQMQNHANELRNVGASSTVVVPPQNFDFAAPSSTIAPLQDFSLQASSSLAVPPGNFNFGASSSHAIPPGFFSVGVSSPPILPPGGFNFGASSSFVIPPGFSNFGAYSSTAVPVSYLDVGASSSSFVPPENFDVGASSSTVIPTPGYFRVGAYSSAFVPARDFDANISRSADVPPLHFDVGASSTADAPPGDIYIGPSSSARASSSAAPEDSHLGVSAPAFPPKDFA